MKKGFIIIGMLIFAFSLPAQADFIKLDYLSPNDGKLTLDTATGLEWLNLTETYNLSVYDFQGGANGLVNNGFRYATRNELGQLFTNVGLDPLASGNSHEFYQPATRLIGLMGGPSYVDPNGWQYISGIADPSASWPPTVPTPGYMVAVVNVFAYHSTQGPWPDEIGVHDFTYPAVGQSDMHYSNIGHWVVRPHPATITVAINIRPWSKRNPINYKGHGILPVAILSTEDFDAPGKVDQNSLTFGATGNERSLAFCNRRPKDVSRDGSKDDLVCHFYIEVAAFKCGDTEGILNGKTVSGIPIAGEDMVRIIHCK